MRWAGPCLQANELRETIQQFGEGSAQVAELLKLHAAETAKAAQDAAKSEYDSLRAQMDALEQQRVPIATAGDTGTDQRDQ